MARHSQNELEDALLAHQQGRLEEAEEIYQKLLESMPKNADILHLLGALLHQKGDVTQAEQFLNKALELNPHFPEALNSRGILLKEAGQLAKAEKDFRAALQDVPEFPQAQTNLADVLRLTGKFDAAKEFVSQAITLAPDLAPAYNNLGAIERDLSNYEDALSGFQKALDIDAELIDAAINLATTLNVLGRREEAIRTAKNIIQKVPDYAVGHNCLGSCYFDNGDIEEARICFEQALTFEPLYAEAHNNLANTLVRLGELEDAVIHFDKALKLAPENADFWANKAAGLQAQNQIERAIEASETALKINPKHADALWNRGIARLISGDLAGGFTDYEARWELPEFKMRKFSGALWKGEAIEGKSILLHSEQGYGDTLQFIRYVSQISAHNPRAIYLETHEPLRRLLAPIVEITQIFVPGDALPEIDFHSPLLGLPHILGTTLETIPEITANFAPAIEATYDFSADSDNQTKFKIGLVWAGRPSHKNDRNRSLNLAILQPLFEVPKGQFFSLQLGAAQKDLSHQTDMVDLSPHLVDFAATAAIIEHLDLIITVDTAIAHLAGTLGKKCWILLPFAPDWRWLQDRNDSPWYPSVTLFRQATPGDWADVIAAVAAEITSEIARENDR